MDRADRNARAISRNPDAERVADTGQRRGDVFACGHVFTDRIFGSIVFYLLIGLIWAVAYALVDAAVPAGFFGAGGAAGDLGDWLYFSLVTLTTLGYGDITPVARMARSLATLEALIGQLYPAIIIARLVHFN